MASIKTKFTVGLFIAIGLMIAIIAIIWLGMSKYLEKGQHFAAYFEESVQGLDRDSPVKYLGVPVGRVVSVSVAPDGTLVQVVMKIEAGLKPEDRKENIVAQLKSIGITGIMFLELDRKKVHEPDLSPKLTFEPNYPVISTKPSEITLFIEGVNDVLKQFKTIDGKGMIESVQATLQKINQAVEDAEVKKISDEARLTLKKVNTLMDGLQWHKITATVEKTSQSVEMLIKDARSAMGQLDQILAENKKGVAASVQEAHHVLRNAGDTITRLNEIISENKQAFSEAVSGFHRAGKNIENLTDIGQQFLKRGDQSISELQHRLVFILQNLEKASEDLDGFIEKISDHPSLLLSGEPPPPKEIEPDTTEKK